MREAFPGLQRWLAPVLLAIIVPLLFSALPAGPLQVLARDAGLVKRVRAEIATLHVVRSEFQQAEQDSPARAGALSGVERALTAMTGQSVPARETVTVLRDAIAVYAQALTHATAARRYAAPPMQPLPANAIEQVIGQLQANDEARLQEPLLAMRLAAAALRSAHDPRQADQLSRWATIFAARLDAMAIPQGTRAVLETRLAAYEHAVFGVHDTSVRPQVDRETPQAAARMVEAALVNAEQALTAEQQRLNKAFESAGKGFVWSFVAALGASLVIVGAGMVGRTVLDYGVTRHAR